MMIQEFKRRCNNTRIRRGPPIIKKMGKIRRSLDSIHHYALVETKTTRESTDSKGRLAIIAASTNTSRFFALNPSAA